MRRAELQHPDVFWSAALFRRFFCFSAFNKKQAKQSGGKAPHSKNKQNKAAEKRRTPKKSGQTIDHPV
ncbi:MAG TPA: hypothetical protein VMG10_31785 [Gemmataceae bacterium]|nr:hypothetical protein [Gemmataceae bacterium]